MHFDDTLDSIKPFLIIGIIVFILMSIIVISSNTDKIMVEGKFTKTEQVSPDSDEEYVEYYIVLKLGGQLKDVRVNETTYNACTVGESCQLSLTSDGHGNWSAKYTGK